MRHGKKINHLGRTSSHRKALLSNMASSLILHKRITTTVAKAKELRKYVEPLITKTKEDSTHSRRVAFSYLQNKFSVQELFGAVAEKTATRPGGYTRIIRLGNRLGDNAEICMMELVDFNELLIGDAAAKPKAKRTRRSKAAVKADDAAAPVADAVVVEETPTAEAPEEVASEVADEVAPEAAEPEAGEAEGTDSEEEEKK
jgi:large subunit ribosomal protein L17